uniref:EF-hand domain-containing protein n=1 Tax=Cyclophora tenuis TaxID=216820 RepID=A0A7S1DCI9_CYCTE|mmetsp:Transcript_9054/g.15182  ORF Transcript_9054/g.15182 Transcript_9054/m.15182 type:complete len:191 (+) Transcript_9054:68-640(+)|eukprot:CAMPEP_0116558772 /NCGR_PEP_ID=MMETSP0397-20121206/10008_1 /TAXON_ID=216820 /ORGANISM="Cyclophora tenuis, Strain ECT3854" /LENGTH=190 /DNA_ID=CAMNT_0004084431 /DNA_START=52 /DNA_END=627 /DNA_ORIENTATION=+
MIFAMSSSTSQQQRQQQHHHNRNVGITGPKTCKRTLRDFNPDEAGVLQQWSLLPRLFADWDLDGSGKIDRNELLYGIREFCRANKIVYSHEIGRQIMEAVDHNGDSEFDQDEFTKFLNYFSRSVNVSMFDVIYFMQDLLADREEWELQGEQTLLVPPVDRSPSFLRNLKGGETLGAIWNSMQISLESELR